MSRLAVIPARGGSKRIPGKNIRLFAGKPMIVWSIEAARSAGVFDRIIVSTDDEAIAAIARNAGAEVPFMRPRELSDDHTATIPVIAHAIEAMSTLGFDASDVCCLYATAPFVSADDIRQSYEVFRQGNWRYCFTVTDFPAPVFRSFELRENGSVQMFWPENFSRRSQDLPQAYHDAGQFYWGTNEAWLSGDKLFAEYAHGFRIPRWRVQDIDTPDDWERAELMAPAIFRSGQ